MDLRRMRPLLVVRENGRRDRAPPLLGSACHWQLKSLVCFGFEPNGTKVKLTWRTASRANGPILLLYHMMGVCCIQQLAYIPARVSPIAPWTTLDAA